MDLLPAIRLGWIEPTETYEPSEPSTDTQGDVCEGMNRHLGHLSVGSARAYEPMADGLSGTPETRPVIVDHHNQESTHPFPAVRELKRRQTRNKSRS